MLPNPQTALTVAESLETLETSHSKSQMLETYRDISFRPKQVAMTMTMMTKLMGLSTWPVWVECESPLSWLLAILLLHKSFQMLPYMKPSLLLMGYVLAW